MRYRLDQMNLTFSLLTGSSMVTRKKQMIVPEYMLQGVRGRQHRVYASGSGGSRRHRVYAAGGQVGSTPPGAQKQNLCLAFTGSWFNF